MKEWVWGLWGHLHCRTHKNTMFTILNFGSEIINFFMLNSAEHEILNAHKYKIPRSSAFLGSDKHRMLFFLLINVKMPTIVVGI